MKKKKGLFITMEGVDGCGKSLMAELLARRLLSKNYDVLLTREPGGSPLGRSLRQILLHGSEKSLIKEAETLLFAADRAQHCREIILPALDEGKIVVCDRFTDSTLAYQGGGRGIDIDFLLRLNEFASQGLAPDCTFYLRLSLKQALGRRQEEADRMEQEDIMFFGRVMGFYESLAQKEPGRIKVINAAPSPNKVLAEIEDNLKGLLPEYDLKQRV